MNAIGIKKEHVSSVKIVELTSIIITTDTATQLMLPSSCIGCFIWRHNEKGYIKDCEKRADK